MTAGGELDSAGTDFARTAARALQAAQALVEMHARSSETPRSRRASGPPASRNTPASARPATTSSPSGARTRATHGRAGPAQG